MTHLVIRNFKSPSPLEIPTYIGYCCREWVLAVGFRGRCGLCGEIPIYHRADEESS